tara:strand:- start:15758 stop:16819 length:1062 start_codon:yes stop_codon:yes gene_type:complete
MGKRAVYLVNLGSPDSTEVSDVRRYLDEFLMDKYVIDAPFLVRLMVVKCFVLPFRPKKSAEAYESIWWDEGSPLIVLSKRLLSHVQKKCNYPVGLGMRYGSPSILSGLQELVNSNPDLEEVFLFPLYPHYAMATTTTVVEKTKEVMSKHFPHLTLSYIESYYDYKPYINALTASIKANRKKENWDHLLFSFHGVPERHVKKTDKTKSHCMKVNNCCYSDSKAHEYCYSHHVHKTALLVVEQLNLKPDEYTISFQSRLGNDPWLSPATDSTLERLAKKGIKNIGVVCPAFVSDCLETLEEIGEEGKEIFLENGGERFSLIDCLNEDPLWVDTIISLIKDLSYHKQAGKDDFVIN